MDNSLFCDADRKRLEDLGADLWKPAFQSKSLFLDGVFPSDEGYSSSLWADWENRIREGERAEHELYAKQFDELMSDRKFAVNSDEYWRVMTEGLCRPLGVSHAMYAAIFVSVWANLEMVMRQLFATARLSLRDFQKPGREFREIKRQYRELLSIDVEEVPSYSYVNAVRILNNAFKHGNGGYQNDPSRKYEQIDGSLLDRWGIVEGQGIDYTELPLKEVIVASHCFCTELFERTDAFVRRELVSREKLALPQSQSYD